MANPIEIVKAHPVATGIVVVLVVGVVLLFSGGGGAATEYTSSGGGNTDGELAASLQMQQIQAQAGLVQYQTNAEKEVALNNNATQLTLAQLAKETALATLGANVQLEEERLASQERTTITTNTLAATLKQQELTNAKAASDAQYATLQEQSKLLFDIQKLNSQTQLGLVKEQNKPKGLFSWLFG